MPLGRLAFRIALVRLPWISPNLMEDQLSCPMSAGSGVGTCVRNVPPCHTGHVSCYGEWAVREANVMQSTSISLVT